MTEAEREMEMKIVSGHLLRYTKLAATCIQANVGRQEQARAALAYTDQVRPKHYIQESKLEVERW